MIERLASGLAAVRHRLIVDERGAVAKLGFVGTSSVEAPWTPLDLPGLVAWYDASDAGTLTDAGSGHISAWADKSGNGNTLSQATDSKRPRSGTRSQNSLNVLDFIPANVMHFTAASDFLATGTNPITVYAACKSDETSAVTWRRLFHTGNTTGGQLKALAHRGSAAEYVWNDGANDAFAGTWDTGVKIVSGYDTNGAQLIRANGAQITTNTKSRNKTSGTFAVGIYGDLTSNPWDGWIGELIFANAQHDGTTIGLAETYLNDKWAIF